MEGTDNQGSLRVSKVVLAIIVIFHLVGLTGFLMPVTQPYFIRLVPFHLLLMFILIIVAYNAEPNRLLFFIAGTFICGFLVEVLGVHTGKIFGNYHYGNTLGLKLAAVPLLMGVNWVILIYSIGQMVRQLNVRSSILASLTGGLLLIVFDFFMEPVSMYFNYWQWDADTVPLQNYISWFVVSVVLLKFYYSLNIKQQKHIGLVMFVSQLVFFVVLNLAGLVK